MISGGMIPGSPPTIPRAQRESDCQHAEALYARIRSALEPVHAAGGSLDELAVAVVGALRKSERTNVRDALLARAGKAPRCWICNRRIWLDAEPETDGRLSVDHVVRRCDGGVWSLENCRLAHALCNATRTVLERGGKLRPSVRQRLKAMRSACDAREMAEREQRKEAS